MSKIAFISTMEGESWGGSEVLWSEAAHRLHAQGVHIGASVKGWPETPAAITRLSAAGIQVAPRRINLRWKRLLGKYYGRGFYQWVGEFAPDLVVLCLDYQSNGREWMDLCRELKLPYVIIVQSVVEHAWPGDAHNLALAEGYREARAVYFVSQANLHWTRAQLAQPLPQAKVVRNPFNVPFDAAPPWPAATETLKLACIGRVQPAAKGQDLLFEVLRQEKWKARPVELTLFGKGEWRRSLEALQAMYGLEKVRFGSFSSDIASVWSEYHALVLPSRYEGLPLVVVEAMLCGRPCIVTDVAGNAELIEDNVSGFVAAAAKAEFLDEAMERAWERRADLPEIGRRAAEQVRRLVPRDPAGVLAEELLAVLAQVKPVVS